MLDGGKVAGTSAPMPTHGQTLALCGDVGRRQVDKSAAYT